MFHLILIMISVTTVHCNHKNQNEINTTVAISETIALSCPIPKNENDTVIFWLFDNETISAPTASKSKDIFSHIRPGENGSLIITNVTQSDAKIYVCIQNETLIVNEGYIRIIVKENEIINFAVESASDSTLTFSWNIKKSKSTPVSSFNLTLCKKGSLEDCTTVPLRDLLSSYTFYNLPSFTKYEASINGIDISGFDKVSIIQTSTLPGSPISRPFVSEIVSSNRSVLLEIDCVECKDDKKMQGTLKWYFISCTHKPNVINETVKIFNTSMVKTQIYNLNPYTNYSCFIYASNGIKHGPSYKFFFKTLQDFPRTPLFFTGIPNVSGTVTLIWRPGSDSNGPLTGYLLKVCDAKQHKMIVEVNLERTINMYKIKNLTSRTEYIMKLWAVNEAGLSRNPSEYKIITDRKKPDKPLILGIQKTKSSFCVIFDSNEEETKSLKHQGCFYYGNKSEERSCFDIRPEKDLNTSHVQCQYLLNGTKNLVDIPFTMLNKISDVKEVMLSIKISVNSDICDMSRKLCYQLHSESLKQSIDLNDFPKRQSNSETRGISSITWTLFIFIFILILFFLVGLIIWKKNVKYFCFSTRRTLHFPRIQSDFLETCIIKQQQSVLPLEKSPYPFIHISNLVEHIQKYRADDGAGFQAEFEAIESMDIKKWSATHASFRDNIRKNRYTNILPYDHSRVILQNCFPGKSDYINASFIDGFQRPNGYIATQGPLNETICDFWQMVWEQNSHIIVMISNFVERTRSKCDLYWSPKKQANYGNISVRHVFEKEMAYYTERHFKIRNKKIEKERTVYHFQYTDWSDFNVPPTVLPVLVFLRATTRHWKENSGPIIVHCSAGVGRTGTYICIASQIRQLEIEHQINVRGFLEHIRQQRMKLVQTESQYAFIHDVLYEYFIHPDQEIPKFELSSYITKLVQLNSLGTTKLILQFKECIAFEPTDFDYTESKKPCNVSKNRSGIVLPIEPRRINLSSEPGVEGSNYINASAIQGYWYMKEFIITQHPLEETEQDFWKMVWDQNCSLIVLLSNENLHKFWTTSDNNTRDFRGINVTHCSHEEMECSAKYGFLISSSREDYALECDMLCLKSWPDTVSQCTELLRILFEVNSRKLKNPVIVIDEFGRNRAGIFVAMSSLLHQLKTDQAVNVYFVMKMIHIERPHVFTSSDELLFLYELLEFVIEHENTYAFFSQPDQDSVVPNGFIAIGDRTTDNKSPLLRLLIHHDNSNENRNNNTPSSLSSSSSSVDRRHYAKLRSTFSLSTNLCRQPSVDLESSPVFKSPNNGKYFSSNRTSWNCGDTRSKKTNVTLKLVPLSLDGGSSDDWPSNTNQSTDDGEREEEKEDHTTTGTGTATGTETRTSSSSRSSTTNIFQPIPPLPPRLFNVSLPAVEIVSMPSQEEDKSPNNVHFSDFDKGLTVL